MLDNELDVVGHGISWLFSKLYGGETMQLTTTQKSLKATMTKSMELMGDEIKKALPKHMDQGRFSRVVMTAISRTPKLLETDQNSFFGSILLAAQLGLEPNGPDQKCYLIPYGKECQFQLGYRGLLDLARRSGEIVSLHAEVAYQNDELEVVLGINPTITHKPLLTGERGEAVLAYSVAKLKDGSTDFSWMTVEEIEKARKMNKGRSPAWDQWWSEMAKKVVMKRHLKTLPLNAEIQRIVSTDETVQKELSADIADADTGLSMEEVDAEVIEGPASTLATKEEKAKFYEHVSTKGWAHKLTLEEKTKINQGIEAEELRDLIMALSSRKELKDAAKETTSKKEVEAL